MQSDEKKFIENGQICFIRYPKPVTPRKLQWRYLKNIKRNEIAKSSSTQLLKYPLNKTYFHQTHIIHYENPHNIFITLCNSNIHSTQRRRTSFIKTPTLISLDNFQFLEVELPRGHLFQQSNRRRYFAHNRHLISRLAPQRYKIH